MFNTLQYNALWRHFHPFRQPFHLKTTFSDGLCLAIKQKLIPRIKQRFAEQIRFEHIKVDDIEAFKLQLLYEKRYGSTDDELLKMFVGDAFLSGQKVIEEKLAGVVAEQLNKGAVTLTLAQAKQRSGVLPVQGSSQDRDPLLTDRFHKLKPAAVALAGLVDGVNPCAFTTLVFFLSLLATLKKSKRQILVVGLCFAASVFATYLALGVGASRAIKLIAVSSGVSRLLSFSVGGFACLLGVFCFCDFIDYRKSGRAEDISLKLPRSLRVLVNRTISKQIRTRNLVVASLLLGAVVSVLESLCTGQVYLPTIVYVLEDRYLTHRALAWLVFYNLMFILPLLVVFGLAYFGVASRRMVTFTKRHVGSAKLVQGLLFLVMGALLIGTAL